MQTNFSNYIAYVDESGDHGLHNINRDFSVFCLSLCLIEKSEYIENIMPAFLKFKLKYWGHDNIILHEREIRKSENQFSFLLESKERREEFYHDLNQLMTNANFKVFSAIIYKDKLVDRYPNPWNPYGVSLQFCLEGLLPYLLGKDEKEKSLNIIFESRGKNEDTDLELAFHRIVQNRSNWGWKNPDFTKVNFIPLFAKKASNLAGLQLADLIARPIARKWMRPNQKNRAYDIIKPKIVFQKNFP